MDTPGEYPAQKRAREPDAAWTLEPHACRACFGRLVSRPADTPGGYRVYQCTNCGLETAGASPSVACCCGMKVRKALRQARQGAQMIDAGIRCVVNPSPSPEFPSLIVAREVGS